MTANVTIEVARADDVLRVPNAALRFRPTQSEPGNPGASGDGPALASSREGDSRQRGPRVWTLQGGQLHAVRVETGLSDGTTTAVVGGDLDESAQVVTGVATAGTSASQTSATSPFLPQRPGGNRNANRQRTGAAR
jgi:HlyD family secretion protein